MIRRNRLKPSFETLENRNLLAGNVNAVVRDGDLYVNGDGSANTITVESAGAGVVQVRGFDGGGFATKVNGSANALRTFDVAGDIFIRMGGGDDLVRVTNLIVSGELLVDLGSGNDEAVLGRDTASGDLRFGATASGPLYVDGLCRVLGGDHSDLVSQSDVHVQGSGVVNLGNGNDRLQMQRPALSQANVDYGGALTVLPGLGSDAIDLTGLVVNNSMSVNDAGGTLAVALNSADVHGNLLVIGAEGNDQVNIQNVNVRAQLTVNTADGADRVTVSAIADRLYTDLGANGDELTVSSANIRLLSLQLGIGSDTLNVQSSHTTRINAFGNDGNDLFQVKNTRAVDAYFYGEAHFDSYRDSMTAPNQIGNLRLFTIEKVEHV